MGNFVWVYPNAHLDIHEFLQFCSECSIKGVIVHIAAEGYREPKFVPDAALRFIRGCKKAGLQVHGMIHTLTTIPPSVLAPRFRHWFAVDYHGISCYDEPIAGNRKFLDPNQAEVVDFVVELAKKLLLSVPELDGLQLDFIRYFYKYSQVILETPLTSMDSFLETVKHRGVTYFPTFSQAMLTRSTTTYYRNYSYCFCSTCIRDFLNSYGLRMPQRLFCHQDQADWILENYGKQWSEYRGTIITSLVRRIYESVRDLGSYALSATFWYNAPYRNELTGYPFVRDSEYTQFGQAWWEWAEQGLVDFVCPMNYWLVPESFENIITHQIERLPRDVPLYAGILCGPDFPLDDDVLKEYRSVLKNTKAAGACFFHYDTWNNRRKWSE